MAPQVQYAPGPASDVEVIKDGEKWTLILTRVLRHSREKVWEALTDPDHLREWSPFEVDADLARAGVKVNLTWSGTGRITEAHITRAEAPQVLEFGDIRWELEPTAGGTRLTLWHSIDRRFIAWGAAGWHICFDVLDRLLRDDPIGRIAGADAMKLAGWQRLTGEYAALFGAETPGAPSKT